MRLGFAQVLVDHAGADVGDFGALGEPVGDKRVQILLVPHRDVDQEILSPRDHEDADRLGQPGDPVTESLDVAPQRRADAEGDECLYARPTAARLRSRTVPRRRHAGAGSGSVPAR